MAEQLIEVFQLKRWNKPHELTKYLKRSLSWIETRCNNGAIPARNVAKAGAQRNRWLISKHVAERIRRKIDQNEPV